MKSIKFYKIHIMAGLFGILIGFAWGQNLEITEQVDIAPVWAGHPVGFDLETVDSLQYVVFYDANRRMTVGKRTLGSNQWQFEVLPSTTGWDSHNYIVIVLDEDGYIHISGNMHNVPLIYFRSTEPYEIDNFESPGMVGSLESSVTYPVFFKDSEGGLFFQYRDGGSGSGTTIWNQYNIESKSWSRVTDQGLFNGEGTVNAYSTRPKLGPDGYFHIIWMWRDTPVANTNHHLSHIRSQNLFNWETMGGQPVTLPITLSTPDVVADPVTSGNGLINISFGVGWDTQDRAILTYHKYDGDGISQVYNTRWEGNRWAIYQTSDWDNFRWDLDRQGSLGIDVSASPLEISADSQLIQNYYHVNYGDRVWTLDEETLLPTDDSELITPSVIQQLQQVESSFPDMKVNLRNEGEWYLRWETLPTNQDQPRSEPWPNPGMLRLYRIMDPDVISIQTQIRIPSRIKQIEGKLIIQLPPNDKSIVRLLGLDGTITAVFTSSEGMLEISTGEVPKGMYILDVRTANAIVDKKLVVVQ